MIWKLRWTSNAFINVPTCHRRYVEKGWRNNVLCGGVGGFIPLDLRKMDDLICLKKKLSHIWMDFTPGMEPTPYVRARKSASELL